MDSKNQLIQKCRGCGGVLKFEAGASALKCSSCGVLNEIVVVKTEAKELPFEEFLEKAEADAQLTDLITVSCTGCGAEVSLEEGKVTGECAFCGTQIVAHSHSQRKIKPTNMLPFDIKKEEARVFFKKWLSSRRFAPGALKKIAKLDKLQGIYLPYWTYDTDVTSHYQGERGEYYYVSVPYTTTQNGKTITRTRQERRTRWYPISGSVRNHFDDTLALGSKSVNKSYADELEPWDLDNLVPFSEDFVRGYKMESYSIDLKEGFRDAENKNQSRINDTISNNIGGDEQRISGVTHAYHSISFKHILLPIWISSYKFKEKLYQIFVNGRTGEIHGGRPWSIIKIAATVIVGIGIATAIGLGVYFYLNQG